MDVTQDLVLGFLKERGGKVRSSELLERFKAAFPEEPQRKAAARQTFKSYVDNVAFVRNEDGEKYVCLRKRFRSPAEKEEKEQQEEAPSAPLRDAPATDQVSGGDAAQVRPPLAASRGSGYGNDSNTVPHSFTSLTTQLDRNSGEMGGKQSCTRSGHVPDVLEITVIGPSPLPVEDGAIPFPGPSQVNPQDVPREDEWSSDGQSLSGSEDNTPRASRKHFLELMMNSSPHLRRSLGLRGCAYLSNNDSDSSSLEEDRTTATLDPLEHAWMMSSSDGEWAGLHRLLTSEPSLVLRKDFVTGFTCLHWAAKHGKPEVLALVVNFAKQNHINLSVDVRSNSGYTPLHVAAMHGHMEVVKLLVGAYSADVEIRDYSGRKACHYLADGASVDIRDIIGAYEHLQVENGGRKTGGGRWRFSKVLLKPLQAPDSSDNDSVDGEDRSRQNIVRRRSSLGRIRPSLEKLRLRTSQLVHSTSFRDREELDRSSRRGSFFKRKTHFFV